MIGEAGVVGEKMPLEGDKNVTSAPSPVEAIEIGVERVQRGVNGGVRMIGSVVETDIESKGPIFALGELP
jgi:hypothetical protein